MAKPNISSAPKLQTLPPTSEAFDRHMHRAHYQAMLRMTALDAEPPALQAAHYGWSLDVESRLLLPITIPAYISPLPVGILKMVRCGCSSEQPCSSAR